MKLFACKLALSFLGVSIGLCLSCTEKKQETAPAADKPVVVDTKQDETDPNIIAKIGDYTITKKEFEKRFLMELRPNPYDLESNLETPDAEEALKKMIAEKAIVIEGRKQKLNEDELTQKVIKNFKEKKFVNSMLANYVQGKIMVTNSEIDQLIKSNPKLEREQAKAKLVRAMSGKLLEKYYDELYKKFHVQKLSDNFYKTAQIHQRLLLYPQKPRKMGFIRINQVKNELTAEEKNIVLATYDGGKITLKDWFDTLCEMSPPSRPKDLNTKTGIEKLLDRALKMPIFVAEAKLQGFDKDKNILKEAKDYEDRIVLNKAKREKTKDIKGPIAEEQIVAYFNENKELFGTQNRLKIDQIWCRNLKMARKAKANLDEGKDFQTVKKEYSVGKTTKPINIYLGGEGIFFKELWNGDPNEIVGPIKGFHGEAVKWRIVQILEKNPGKPKEYSSNLKTRIEMKMLEQQRKSALKKYEQEILEEYPYEIYPERFRDIDPLDIP
jgi:peptidyl-prolyl cis-trans isomerase C